MTPLEHYQKDLQREDFNYDAAQEQAVLKLQKLYEELVEQKAEPKTSLWSKISPFAKPAEPEHIQGLYFWGGVGRGKTYLMDVFFNALPFEQKLRLHFHRFMQQTHKQLKALDGQKNPLDIIAKDIASKYRVICFDEFFVSDITDAMILGGLFSQLFDMGVVLVATSNIVPERLYENGLQRQRFMPAIKALQAHCEVVNVDSGVDYRLRSLEQAQLYYTPLNDDSEKALRDRFISLAPDAVDEAAQITINDRVFQSVALVDDVIWLSFEQLCDLPRSQNDYIELARLYHAVVISGVVQMGRENDDQARRFINMIDEFYDRSVKVIMSAEVSIEQLYTGDLLSFEFERTQSRLLEMQSQAYLACAHKA